MLFLVIKSDKALENSNQTRSLTPLQPSVLRINLSKLLTGKSFLRQKSLCTNVSLDKCLNKKALDKINFIFDLLTSLRNQIFQNKGLSCCSNQGCHWYAVRGHVACHGTGHGTGDGSGHGAGHGIGDGGGHGGSLQVDCVLAGCFSGLVPSDS